MLTLRCLLSGLLQMAFAIWQDNQTRRDCKFYISKRPSVLPNPYGHGALSTLARLYMQPLWIHLCDPERL